MKKTLLILVIIVVAAVVIYWLMQSGSVPAYAPSAGIEEDTTGAINDELGTINVEELDLGDIDADLQNL